MNDLGCWGSKFKYCYYSVRLLRRILVLNKRLSPLRQVDISEIKKAIFYAKKYHGAQMRQSGEPYYSHPLEVAYMVAPYCFKTDILITSILHDTIEDTELTKDMITYIFDENIANKVDDLTRVKSDRKISAAEIVQLLWHQKKEELLLIKLFDRLHNMQTIGAKSPEKISKNINETLKQFISLAMYFRAKIPQMRGIENHIIHLCYKHSGVKQPKQHLIVKPNNFQLPFLIFQNEQFQT